MYCYSFTRFFGHDRVAILDSEIDCQAGDLLLLQWEYFLALWDVISWWTDYRVHSPSIHLAEKELFDEGAMAMIHRLVYEYYTSYRNIIALFMTDSLEKLLQRKHSPTPSSYRFTDYDHNKEEFVVHTKRKEQWQSLLLFPDLWTLYNHMEAIISKDRIAVVGSGHTEKQRNDLFWSIKDGGTPSLACTHAWLFQCRHDLRAIYVVRPHAWYYKNRQDPRYDSVAVCKKLATIYGATLVLLD